MAEMTRNFDILKNQHASLKFTISLTEFFIFRNINFEHVQYNIREACINRNSKKT